MDGKKRTAEKIKFERNRNGIRFAAAFALFCLLYLNGISPAADGSGSFIKAAAADSAAGLPQGPSYSEDGSQIVYTNIYFGSYPQSEVKGEALTSAITEIGRAHV